MTAPSPLCAASRVRCSRPVPFSHTSQYRENGAEKCAFGITDNGEKTVDYKRVVSYIPAIQITIAQLLMDSIFNC